jgi:hypothetical protein
MDSLNSYWDSFVAFILPYWDACVAYVASIPAPIILGWYVPGLILLGFVLGYALRASISRRRRNRARRARNGW